MARVRATWYQAFGLLCAQAPGTWRAMVRTWRLDISKLMQPTLFLMDCYEVFLWTPNSSHPLWKATNVMSKQTIVCIEYWKWSQGPFGFPAVFVHHPVQGILPPTCCKSSYLTACESLKWSQVNWATVCIEGASNKHITSISRIPAGLMDPGILQPWVPGANIILHDITVGAWLIW